MRYKLLIQIALILCYQVSTAQKPKSHSRLNKDVLLEYTNYFNIENNQFLRADLLINALKKAQFVALGELHNRKKLGELTSALLLELNKNGFKDFALEIGPYSAEKLESLIKNRHSNLEKFYSNYSSKLLNIYPIPFHTGVSDLKFLRVADSSGYNLWGLDQEFYFGFQFLLDELKSLRQNSFSSTEEQIHKTILGKIQRWNKSSRIFKNFDLACKIKNDRDFQAYLNIFKDSSNICIQNIIREIKLSLHIYCLSERGRGGNKERISHFLENFNQILKSSNSSVPKVFVKMGSQHLGRYKSSLGFNDIGNQIKSIADSLDNNSIHIRYLNRFYNGSDNLSKKAWKSVYNFISVGKKDEWTLIDLRPLRQKLIDKTLFATKKEQLEIVNYDFIIIPPEDKKVKKHY